MKILHVHSERGFRGGERQVLLLVRGLRDRGHEQLVFCDEQGELGRKLAEDGFETATYRRGALLGSSSPAISRALKKAATRFQPDIVHAHTGHGHTMALALRGRVPIVVTRRVDFAVKKNMLSARKYTAPGQHFIAISSGVRDVLIQGGVPADRIDIVHSGVDTARVQGGDGTALWKEWLGDGDGPLIGFVGALVDHKAPWILAEAAVIVRQQLPGTRVVLVGEGEERDRVVAAAQDDPGAIHLAGWRDDVADCYAAFDIFVMPSKLEGLCTALIDALAAGVPAIATRTGGIPDVVENGVTGNLVDPLNATAIATAIINLWSDKNKQRLYIENGLKKVEEQFTAQAMVQGTEKAYLRRNSKVEG